jgi:hypothetical protein
VLVTSDNVDIWISDQARPGDALQRVEMSGVPEQGVLTCSPGRGFGRGNGPQAEPAILIANQFRGTPIHMLWTRGGLHQGRPIAR